MKSTNINLGKLWVFLVIIVGMSLMFGCKSSVNNDSDIEKDKEVKSDPKIKEEIVDEIREYKEIESSKSPVKVEDIDITFIEITEPDTVGTTWMIHTVTNNSAHNIAQVKQKITMDDKFNYIVADEILRPKKTSSKLKGFAPVSKNIADVTPVSLEIAVLQTDAKVYRESDLIYILYDYELDSYKMK